MLHFDRFAEFSMNLNFACKKKMKRQGKKKRKKHMFLFDYGDGEAFMVNYMEFQNLYL